MTNKERPSQTNDRPPLPPLPPRGKRKLRFGYVSLPLLLLLLLIFSHLPRFWKHVTNLIHDLSSIAAFELERWKNQRTRLIFILTGIFNFGLLVLMFLTHALTSNSFLLFILIWMVLRPPSSYVLNCCCYCCYSSFHGGHASPKKHRVVYNFLSFYSVIVKLGTKKELVIL